MDKITTLDVNFLLHKNASKVVPNFWLKKFRVPLILETKTFVPVALPLIWVCFDIRIAHVTDEFHVLDQTEQMRSELSYWYTLRLGVLGYTTIFNAGVRSWGNTQDYNLKGNKLISHYLLYTTSVASRKCFSGHFIKWKSTALKVTLC